ncbi:unnamed protein product [Meloidogyne enterolobii]|uniref:Uncharacterized protein n=1 Tax=Meloidogyne enterolobii TaxID=390850 RepID=A0ACB0YMV7_MELEN
MRSPWTNTYDPPLEDGIMPSDKLRKLEIEVNAAFEAYRDMYFEGGVSSVYFWDIDNGFAGVVLLKKETDGAINAKEDVKGCWDSIHVVECNERKVIFYLEIWICEGRRNFLNCLIYGYY